MSENYNPNTDFTLVGLRDKLNEKYGVKKNGKPFTNQDIFMYARRGNLPKSCGGFTIEKIEILGKQILRIKEFDE